MGGRGASSGRSKKVNYMGQNIKRSMKSEISSLLLKTGVVDKWPL